MVDWPIVLVYEPNKEVAQMLNRVLSTTYTVLMAPSYQLACELLSCIPSRFSAVLIEGGHWRKDLEIAQRLIGFVKESSCQGAIIIMASDPAYPYERLGANRVVGFDQLVKKLAEILAKK